MERALLLGAAFCGVLPLVGILDLLRVPKTIVRAAAALATAGIAYWFGGDILHHIHGTLSDDVGSPLDAKDETDWRKLLPLVEMAKRHTWFLALVGAICAWGAVGVCRALKDPMGGGLGLAVATSKEEDAWIVEGVQPAGPACGQIQPGARIVEVDGTSVKELLQRKLEAKGVLKGEVKSKCALVVLDKGAHKPRKVTITRGESFRETAKSR